MAELQQVRHRFIVMLVVLLAVDAVALAFLASPWGKPRLARQEERDRLFRQVREREVEVAPLRDMDGRLALAHDQIAGFENRRLPSQYSAISETLDKLAAENRVQVSDVKYDPSKDVTQGLRGVEIDLSLGGDYASVVRFINSLERSKTFFIIDSVVLGEQQGGTVKLQLKCETYMRGAA